jgi:small subunit ribosomal protein S18
MGRSNKREKVVNKRQVRELSRRFKPKPCHFCTQKIEWIDYKDVSLLRKYVSDRGKIRSRRITGTCIQHQREISVAVKTARELMLLPYTQRDITLDRGTHRGYGRNYNLEDEATLDDVMNSEQYLKSQQKKQAQITEVVIEKDEEISETVEVSEIVDDSEELEIESNDLTEDSAEVEAAEEN